MRTPMTIHQIHDQVFACGYTGLMSYCHSTGFSKHAPWCVSVLIPGHGRVELGRGDTKAACLEACAATLKQADLTTLAPVGDAYPESTYAN